MTQVSVKTENVIDITPDLMAQAFWEFSSDEQADFFHELALAIEKEREINGNKNSYSYGEMQWCYMTGAIKKRSDKARAVFLSFSAFAYDYFEQKSPF